jgi:hypothetical protein
MEILAVQVVTGGACKPQACTLLAMSSSVSLIHHAACKLFSFSLHFMMKKFGNFLEFEVKDVFN